MSAGSLYQACKDGDAAFVKQFIKSGGEVNERDVGGSAPLHYAIDSGSTELVKLLVKEGLADVEVRRPPAQWTPLFAAAHSGDVDMVKCLLNFKANPAALHDGGVTAGETFAAAASPDQRAAVRAALRERLIKVGLAHIYAHEAAAASNLQRVEWFIDAGGNADLRDSAQQTMLHVACKKGHHNVAQLLLERGAEVDAKDNKKWTPLYVAAADGQLDILKLLLDKGASVNARTADNRTPLHAACRFGHHDAVCALLDKGALADCRDGCDRTPLHWACEAGKVDIALTLLEHKPEGASVGAHDKDQLTPLHWACSAKTGKPDLVAELAKRGAELMATDASGKTPLHLAVAKGHASVMKDLLDRGCDINCQERETKSTPLHVACGFGHQKCVEELLFRRCDTALMDSNGKTAGEVIGRALPPGHVPPDTCQRIAKLLRDGTRPPERALAVETQVVRCFCAIS